MKIEYATRQLIRSSSRGYLSTEFNTENLRKRIGLRQKFPYSTFTLTAFDYDLSPIILLSNLSEHTINLKKKNLVSIMLCEEQKNYNLFPKFNKSIKYEDPMSRPRVTLIGKINITKKNLHRNRFLSRHPASKLYSNFQDMNFYKMKIKGAHLVGGFANVKWFTRSEIICKDFSDFGKHEMQILDHMNTSYQKSLNLYAKKLIPHNSLNNVGNWKLVGIDPEGFDLRKKDGVIRYCFKKIIKDEKKIRDKFLFLHKLAIKN